jgi:hypothetical protein
MTELMLTKMPRFPPAKLQSATPNVAYNYKGQEQKHMEQVSKYGGNIRSEVQISRMSHLY